MVLIMSRPVHRMRWLIVVTFMALMGCAVEVQAAPPSSVAQSDVSALQSRITQLEDRIDNVEEEAAAGGIVLFLFGAFCALWAQNTRRSAWLWFFLGVFFSVFTVIVLLKKNADDREAV